MQTTENWTKELEILYGIMAGLPLEKTIKWGGIVCAHCNKEGHRNDAEYCYSCGHYLNS